MLRSTMIFAIALGFAAPAVAEPRLATGSFEGQSFEYQSKLGNADTILIEGKFVDGGDRFRFTVRPSGRVSGEVGDREVRFQVPKEERDRLAKSLKASEPQVAEAGAAFSAGTN